MSKRYFGRGMWFGALCGAVLLTRIEEQAWAARHPYPGGLLRRLFKLCFWSLPVLWTIYGFIIYGIMAIGQVVPTLAIVLLLIFAAMAVLQTLKSVKMAILG